MIEKVVVWIGCNEIMIPINQIPGAIADTLYPRPDRNGSGWNEPEIPGSPNDACAVERLKSERQQAEKLRQRFRKLPEDAVFSESEAQAYLASLGLELEVRRFGEEPRPKTRTNKTRAILRSFLDAGIEGKIESIWAHIRANTGGDNFPYKSASVDRAVHVDGDSITKDKLERALRSLLKTTGTNGYS